MHDIYNKVMFVIMCLVLLQIMDFLLKKSPNYREIKILTFPKQWNNENIHKRKFTNHMFTSYMINRAAQV